MDTVISPVNIAERKALDIRAGDTVRVTVKIEEKDKKTGKPKFRLQVFEGLCLAVKHGKEAGGTFTIRKVASGVGVERVFPIYSPSIEKIEIVKRSKVRQAKLYHIRDKATKEIRRQMRNIMQVPDAPDIPETEVVVEETDTEEKVEAPAEPEVKAEEPKVGEKAEEVKEEAEETKEEKKEE